MEYYERLKRFVGWSSTSSSSPTSLADSTEEDDIMDPNEQIYLLLGRVVEIKSIEMGQKVKSLKQAIAAETRRLLWFSYRTQFQSIEGTNHNSDSGWGCTLRTGQMLLANAFLYHFLGQRWIDTPEAPDVLSECARVLKWFADIPEAPYSIHRIALCGAKHYGKAVGEWHGPATIASTLSRLVDEHKPDNGNFRAVVCLDGILYRNHMYKTETGADIPENKALLLLVPLRLGMEKFNEVYTECLLSLFALPEFLGFVGGRPSSSYYFIGCQYAPPPAIKHLKESIRTGRNPFPPSKQERAHVTTPKAADEHKSLKSGWFLMNDDSVPSKTTQSPKSKRRHNNIASVLYLDPHVSQPTVDPSPAEFSIESWRYPTVHRMPLSHIDPSMTLGFYVRNQSQLMQLCANLELMMECFEHPILSVSAGTPHYFEQPSVGIVEFDDDLQCI